jgi:CysZ protein
MIKLLVGANYLVNGFSLIAKPGLRRFVIIPVLINTLLFVGLFFIARHFVAEFNAWLASLVPTWLAWLSAIIWLLFFISFFLVLVFGFVVVANLVAAPFNALLAEKVEWMLTRKKQATMSVWENMQDVPRILLRQIAILGFYFPRALVLSIVFFIPFVNVIAPLLWLLFHAYLMALTYVDYPTDNQRISIRDVRLWLRERRMLAYGFGGAFLTASMIPGINLLVMPAAVAGATQLWVDENRKSLY